MQFFWWYFHVYLLFLSLSYGRRHILNLKNDNRKAVLCSHFGFSKGGYFSVSIEKLEGNINHITFTLDKSGGLGVAGYVDARPGNCIRDDSTKFLFLSFNSPTRSLVVNNNDPQLTGIYFEAGTTGIDENENYINQQRTFLEKLEIAMNLLPDPSDQIPKFLEALLQVIKKDDQLNTLASRVHADSKNVGKRPLLAFLYKMAEDYLTNSGSKSLQTLSSYSNIFTNIRESVTKNGSQILIPYYKKDDILKANFTVHFDTHSGEGLYNFYIHNCAEINVETGKRPAINMTLAMVEKNPTSYLSAGQQPLPILYSIMCCTYFALSLVWLAYLRMSKNSVFRIHYLMFAVVLVKSIALCFHGINYFVIGKHGVHEEGWAVMYYITHIIRGALLFITILLIGAGWAFIKHMLTPRERNVFLIVIPLQVLANIATIIIEESEAGAAQYATWKEILIFVDLACCGAILFPVVWSIRHLQAASQTDGKAAINLHNLRLFRHFYVLVICYVYFTRVIVYLMSITIPYTMSWMVELFRELVTFAFFISVGYKFRPVDNNPYLLVSNDEDEEEIVLERIQLEDVWSQSGVTDGVTRIARQQPSRKNLGSTKDKPNPLLGSADDSDQEV